MLLAAILLSAPVLAAESVPASRAAPVLYPAQRGFLDRGKPTLLKLGSARRERLGISMYTVVLYGDLKALKAQLRNGPQSRDRMAALLKEGVLPVALIFRYEQGISAERRKEFNEQALGRCWPAPGFDPGNPAYVAFASHFKDPILRGGEFQVWIQKGTMSLRTGQGPVDRVEYPELCRAFLACYLTDTTLPGEFRTLREELLQDLPTLLERP